MKLSVFGTRTDTHTHTHTHTQKAKPIHPRYAGCNYRTVCTAIAYRPNRQSGYKRQTVCDYFQGEGGALHCFCSRAPKTCHWTNSLLFVS